jgi:hypothetical protein
MLKGSELISIKIYAKTSGTPSFLFFCYSKLQKPSKWGVQISRK